MNHAVKKQRGFTLIELMLAMAFISLLLLAVALTVIQMSRTYNRGMIFKELNQVARTVNDDLRRTINGAQPIDMSLHYLHSETSGRLCLGQATYIWNTEQQVRDRGTDYIGFAQSEDAVRFVKVPDLGGNYCAKDSRGDLIIRDIRESDREVMVDLLKSNDYELSVHGLEVTQNASYAESATGQQLLSVALRLGTSNIEAMNGDQTACLAPNFLDADVSNCLVQEFTIVARTGNKVN